MRYIKADSQVQPLSAASRLDAEDKKRKILNGRTIQKKALEFIQLAKSFTGEKDERNHLLVTA